MDWGYLSKTVTRMEASAESHHGRFYGVPCDHMAIGIPNSCLDQSEIIFKLVSFNGTAVRNVYNFYKAQMPESFTLT